MSLNVEEGLESLDLKETELQKFPKKKNKGKKTQEDESQKSKKLGLSELNPLPDYIAYREGLWTTFKNKYNDFLESQESKEILITLPDGKTHRGLSWKTRPFDIALGISKGLAESAIIAKVNGELYDLERPLTDNCSLELLKFDESEEAKAVYWHSSAHILGESLERTLGGHLCYGPPIDSGFYYDIHSPNSPSISQDDWKTLNSLNKKIMSEKQVFERLELSKKDLLTLFNYNPFKQRILNEKVKEETTTVYKCGSLIDLCRGPHVRHTGVIKSMDVTKSSSSYWEGNSEAETLTRVYGISFPSEKGMKEWRAFQEEAAKRDHRKIGREQDLFFFHELSPGSCFFTPRGAHLYNTLLTFIKGEYWSRGFSEVVTPNIYNSKLWKTSGHWDHYADNMFRFEIEKESFGLKPMNCPGHCIIFDNGIRSWRDLPIRMADFGVLHRNELSGALTGLIRVRRFQQDDAHIFCLPEQIKEEMRGALQFLTSVYETFGFTYNCKLSTRPEKYLGELSVWNQAEADLSEALNESGLSWSYNLGDGAFYGPKIDVTLTDALKRQHQCGTIQLDFQLPLRFNLNYIDEKGDKKHPVIIHRAILGSLERMIAILTENFGGKWPFWLSPRQIMIVPVAATFNDYALGVQRIFHDEGFMTDVNIDNGETLNKKVRSAQISQYNFIFVVGEKEMANSTINVRTRNNEVLGEMTIEDSKQKLKNLSDSRALES